MADAQSSSATLVPAPVADATIDPSLTKISKQLQQLKDRVGKLTSDNKKLKEQLVAAKSTTSRIRRIPKPSKPDDAAAA